MLPCFALGKFVKTGGKGTGVVRGKQHGDGSVVQRDHPNADEALSTPLIIFYRRSLAANLGNLFAVTVLSPRFRRKLRG